MPTADDRNSIVIYKEGDYRGGTKRWSNRYHFEGDLPSDDSAWEAFADAIVAEEKLIYTDDTTIVEAVGYDADSATSTNPHGDAVWTKSYTTAGTGGPWATSQASPGDAASLVRYSTAARSSKNHPVYLMNYYHGCWADAGASDNLNAALKVQLEEYAEDWVAGFTCDGTARERCGPHGAVATGYRVDPYVRHRDFPN